MSGSDDSKDRVREFGRESRFRSPCIRLAQDREVGAACVTHRLLERLAGRCGKSSRGEGVLRRRGAKTRRDRNMRPQDHKSPEVSSLLPLQGMQSRPSYRATG